MHLDQREEVCIIGLMRAAAEGEAEIEKLRQRLCENPSFEPYGAFKALQQRPLTSGVLTASDINRWLARQYYKNSILTERDLSNILNQYTSDGCAMRYESFLKMVLPKQDKSVRSLVMCRRTSGLQLESGELPRDVGFQFIRLLEQESNLYTEMVIRKKRLAEYEWKEDRNHLSQRSFTWMQSQSAVPGVAHVSVLGVARLLCDYKDVMSSAEVENFFYRANTSGTDMLSYSEWDQFLYSREANDHLSELYVNMFSTMCPQCGSACQRDGGACPNVTCSFCGTTFHCSTRTETRMERKDITSSTGRGGFSSPRLLRLDVSDMSPRYNTTLERSLSPRSPRRYDAPGLRGKTTMSVGMTHSGSFAPGVRKPIRSGLKGKYGMEDESLLANAANVTVNTTVPLDDSFGMDTTRYTVGKSPTTGHDVSLMSRKANDTLNESSIPVVSPRMMMNANEQTTFLSKPSYSEAKLARQMTCLRMVMDVIISQIKLDAALEAHKEAFWESGIASEAICKFLDRYNKGYIADTDVWQVMHVESSPGPVSFSGVCAMFREVKDKSAKKPGQLNLAELTRLVFPMYSEEAYHVDHTMDDAEAQNILYILRNTTKCPGCGTRAQRTIEGCPSVTCPYCHSTFRCHNFADHADDKLDTLTLTQKFALRKLLKYAVETAEDHEQLRKTLACSSFSGESLSSILLDAFLLMADDKGYMTFSDMKVSLMKEATLKTIELEMIWHRYAGEQKKLGFGDFAAQMRPFGANS